MSFFDTLTFNLLVNDKMGSHNVKRNGCSVFVRVDAWGPSAVLHFTATADHGALALGDILVVVNGAACATFSVNSVVSSDPDMLKSGTATSRIRATARLDACTSEEDRVTVQVMLRDLPVSDRPCIPGFEGRDAHPPRSNLSTWDRRTSQVP